MQTVLLLIVTLNLFFGQPPQRVNASFLKGSAPGNILDDCGFTVDAGEDIVVCSADDPVNLNGSVSGDYLSVNWEPSSVLNDPNSLSTTANIDQTTEFELTVLGLTDENLIENSSFDDGLSGFSSDYVEGTGGAWGLLSDEGQFAVTTNSNLVHTNFAPCTDFSGSGNMLVVNGAGIPNQNVWCQSISITPNTTYAISAWVTSVIASSPAVLQFSVNGELLGSTFNAPSSPCTWLQFFELWDSGANTTVDICIVNQNTVVGGNDFALDDLIFGPVCEDSDLVTVTFNEVNTEWTPPEDLCVNSSSFLLDDLLSPEATHGGVWTINGSPEVQFNPSTLGAGTHSVSYSVNEPPCQDETSYEVFIEDVPETFWFSPGEVCMNTPAFALGDYLSPVSSQDGQWWIDGNPSDIFDPLELGVGFFLVTYSAGEVPCSSAYEEYIIVLPDANATWISPQVICENEVPLLLDDLLLPEATPGGFWMIEGIETDILAPEEYSSGVIEVTYTAGTPPCEELNTQYINISPSPAVAWQSPEAMCISDTAFVLNTLLLPGSTEEGSWTINGEVSTSFNPEILGTGNHIIAYAAGEAPCANEETFQATVHPVPVALFTAFPDTICLTDTLTVEFTGEDSSDVVYFWNFAEGNIISGEDVGPYTINWDTSGAHIMSLTIEQNGCLSEPFSQQVEVTEALENPVISCINTTLHSVTFGWEEVENAVGYNITTLSGQSGVQENNTFIVENLSPAEEVIIQIEALSGNTCANTFTQYNCVATDCPAVDIEINESVLLCANDGLVALSVSSINVDSLGTGVWSGQGIIDSIQGVFDPAISDSLNTIVFTWTQANCIYADTILLVVNEPPSSDFEITSPICVTESTIITYIGNASPTANYMWNFNGGVAVPDTGSGPLEVSWNSSGLKEVSLQVDENGCSSEESMNIVEVEEPLPPPVLNCNTTTQSITFTWEEVQGAVGYNVNHLSGAMGIQVGSSYEVTSLSSGDEVSIQVEAIGDGACGNSLSEILSCIALDCPNVTIFLETLAAICLNDVNTPLNLTAVVNGANEEGTGTWSGNGITDAVMGIYDATIAGAGEHTITYTYHEGNCVYSQTITITVFETPTASFIADEEICETASSTMIYTGSAGNEAIYTWDFDEGTAIPGTGAGPHEVSWTNSGTYQLSLTVEENACISETETIDIIVGEVLQIPEINCQPTNTSIEFSWLEIPGAEAYEVNVLSGQNGTLNDTSYFLNDLLPLEEVSIEVIALNNGICGNSSSIASCTVSECPSLQAGMNSPDAICIGDELVLGFSINSTSNGPFDIILSDGQAEWTLSGIQDGHESSFSPITSTTYTIISITDLSSPACVYNPPISQTVEVNTPSIAGTALPPIHFCVGTDTLVYLPDLLVGEDIGGQWLETSVFPSFGEGFNSNPATFNTIGQVAGEYSFRYFIAGTAPCEDAESEVSIILDALPIADAGEDKELSCAIEMVTIGGMNTSEESFIDYYWESNNGSFIADSTSNYTEVSQAGIYTLHVQNAETACGTSDEVVVSILLDVPVAEVVVSDISCFQMNDGSIEITSVSGGIPPYLLTLNGVSYSDQNHFDYLGPDTYELKVEDSQGCQSELQIDLLEPNELKVKLTAQLEGDNIIELGDSVQLEVKLNLPLGQQIENILWSPADSVDCKGEDCLHPVVYPENLTTYKIQIVTDHNCRAEDKLTIVVEKPRPVYIPNAFSPDGDGQNDYFMIFAGQQVKKINSFLVFNRWGEPVFQYYNFQPNNPAYGWNGRYRGQIMNPAVFAYYAEIEFIDGEISLYEGDVTLVR